MRPNPRAYPLIAGLAALVVATSALAWTGELTMDALPESEGWTLYDEGTGSSTVDGGILNLRCDYFRFYRAPVALWDETVRNATGWTIEFRMRIIDKGSCYYLADVGLWIQDDVRLRIVSIDPDRFYVAYPRTGIDPPYVPLDATQWHDYRLVSLGDMMWVFIDGVLELTFQDPEVGVGSDGLYFGDLGSDIFAGCEYSNTEWDYVRFETAVPVASRSSSWGQIRSLFR